jgi:hypothetical protein
MVVADRRLVVQDRFERHVEAAALAGIAVHFAAFAGLKMAHPRAAANDLPVLSDLYSLGDALGWHFSKMSRVAQ